MCTRDGRAVPKALAAFDRDMAREPAVFAAHYRPAAAGGQVLGQRRPDQRVENHGEEQSSRQPKICLLG